MQKYTKDKKTKQKFHYHDIFSSSGVDLYEIRVLILASDKSTPELVKMLSYDKTCICFSLARSNLSPFVIKHLTNYFLTIAPGYNVAQTTYDLLPQGTK